MKWTKAINNWERKHIPNLRRNKYYKMSKAILFMPLILVVYGVRSLKDFYKNLSFKRTNKPDIKLSNIVNGWANLFIDDPVVEEIAMKRANICAKCPLAELAGGVYSVVVDNKTTQIQGMKCTACGCPLSAKVRSKNDYCPQGKW